MREDIDIIVDQEFLTWHYATGEQMRAIEFSENLWPLIADPRYIKKLESLQLQIQEFSDEIGEVLDAVNYFRETPQSIFPLLRSFVLDAPDWIDQIDLRKQLIQRFQDLGDNRVFETIKRDTSSRFNAAIKQLKETPFISYERKYPQRRGNNVLQFKKDVQ